MAEIYRDETGKALAFGVTGATVTDVTFTRDGTTVASYTSSDPEVSGNTVLIPYAITRSDGDFIVEWTYTVDAVSYTRKELHVVVTPLFTEAELFAWDSDFSTLTSAQVIDLEQKVRKIIETFTRQTFGYKDGIEILRGTGTFMNSTKRIISVSAIDNYTGGWIIPESKFGIFSTTTNVPAEGLNVKIPIEEETLFSGGTTVATGFQNNTFYTVTGEFGYLSIPPEIKQAALLIAEAFSCNESLWRERYLRAVRAADWRFDVHDAAFTGTGSLVADQLIRPYIRADWRAV